MNNISKEIASVFFDNQDIEYRAFQCRLIPTIDSETVIGVRTPIFRKIAKEYIKHPNLNEFLEDLPHKYHEMNSLHGAIISDSKTYDAAITQIDSFLPYIDNWATCDSLSPKVFKKNREKLRNDVVRWISSSETYTIRFGIGMVMSHFLDEDFDESLLERISIIRSNEYYVNMMIAWFFATALAKQWDASIAFFDNRVLDKWVHNKAIQKAIESYRITPEQKSYLRTLKIK